MADGEAVEVSGTGRHGVALSVEFTRIVGAGRNRSASRWWARWWAQSL